MYSFFPNTLMAAPKAVPQAVSPLQPNRKTVLEIKLKKKITETWLVPSTLPNAPQWDHLPQQALEALQTNKGHFKLINNNILHFKFIWFFSSKNFKEHHQHRINECSFHNSKGEPRNQHPLPVS